MYEVSPRSKEKPAGRDDHMMSEPAMWVEGHEKNAKRKKKKTRRKKQTKPFVLSNRSSHPNPSLLSRILQNTQTHTVHTDAMARRLSPPPPLPNTTNSAETDQSPMAYKGLTRQQRTVVRHRGGIKTELKPTTTLRLISLFNTHSPPAQPLPPLSLPSIPLSSSPICSSTPPPKRLEQRPGVRIHYPARQGRDKFNARLFRKIASSVFAYARLARPRRAST